MSISTKELNIKLLNAARLGKFDLVKEALSNGANINASNKKRRTALSWAIIRGHQEIFDYFIQQGADIHMLEDTEYGWKSPFENAIQYGRLDMVSTLIDMGIDINKPCSGGSHLHRAIMYGHEDIVKHLLERGVVIERLDCFQMTEIMRAARSGYVNIFTMLLDKGANYHLKTDVGNMSLVDLALEGKHFEFAEMIPCLIEQLKLKKTIKETSHMSEGVVF